MNEEAKDLTVVSESPLVNEEDLENAIKKAERMEELVRKIKTLAIKQTNRKDWVDMGGKPYLQSSGAEKIARLFGISWRICDGYPKKEMMSDEKSSYYLYSYKGEFLMGGKSIEVIGTCSQKDKFLGSQGDKNRPASEIDECNIIKKANTNMIARGITTILGIRNMTWEEIEKGGIDTSKTNKATFDSKDISGIVKSIAKKSGEKNGKKWDLFTIVIEKSNGDTETIRTFDGTKGLVEGVEIKASELTAKSYNGKNYFESKKIEIVGDGIEME